MRGTLPGLGIALLIGAGPAAAQVTVNPGALELLPATPKRQTPPNRTQRPEPSRPAPQRSDQADATAAEDIPIPPIPPSAEPPPTGGPPAKTALPALPTVPPAIAALPPPAPIPEPRAEPPPAVPVADDAPGQAVPLTGGLRITFGPGREELNPLTEAALRDLARQVKGREKDTISISAFAAGTPEDPSTARRLSLGRALAARAVLIDDGIASNRIYPRALGAAPDSAAEPDRVDVIVNAAPNGPAAAAPPSPSR